MSWWSEYSGAYVRKSASSSDSGRIVAMKTWSPACASLSRV